MSAKSPTSRQSLPWFRHYWVWLIMLPPIAAVIAGIGTVVIATRNAPDLVVDDYRKIGLANHLKHERDREAANLGLSGRLRPTGSAFVLTIESGAESLSSSAVLTLQLYHPTLPEHDTSLTFLRQPDRTFQASLPVLAQANYHLQLLPDGEDWRLVGRWRVGDASAVLNPGSNAD